LPRLNEKDVLDVPEYALKGMTIHYVSHVNDVFELALETTGAPKKKVSHGKVIRTRTKARAKKKKVRSEKTARLSVRSRAQLEERRR
jgi:hypothetical protein